MKDKNNFVKESFGAILLRERKKKGLSLKKLSENLNNAIAPSYINRLENGEKENPSFALVCALVSELSLDFREVLKSFGYENLINSVHNNGFEKIEEIIRLSNIKAPLIRTTDEEDLDEYLTQDEKEILINLINDIFYYATITNDMREDYIIKIISKTKEYRKKRNEIKQNKAGYYEDDYNLFRKINISNKEFIIIICEDSVFRQIIDYHIDINNLFDVIEKLGIKVLDKEKSFIVADKENKLIINCNKTDKYIEVIRISKYDI